MVDRTERLRSTSYGFEYAGGASLAVTNSSGRVALTGSGPHLLVTNPGTVTVYIEPGTVAVVATVASQAVLPGTQVALSLNNIDSQTYIAGITAAGSSTIQISTGYGI